MGGGGQRKNQDNIEEENKYLDAKEKSEGQEVRPIQHR